jgi:outer membrane protein assembly factor BamB
MDFNQVYFGSSADNAAHCLNAETGEEIWIAFADSAVRLPPTIGDGKAWFGADDGFVYCVSTEDGSEIWRHRAVEKPRMIPSNGKLISPWPIRTGVMIEGGAAYFGSSLFPWEPSFLCSVDAETGESRFAVEQTGVTLQGALLASEQRLYAPQGRSEPLVFAKASGTRVGAVSGSGGVWCILTEREEFIAMPHNQKEKEDVIKLTDPAKRESILSISGATRMIAAGQRIYVHQRGALKALDRDATGKPVWTSSSPAPSALILAGEHLLIGGDGVVLAFEAESGKPVWSAEVPGRVYGLTVANGRLFVSTDHGHIFSFQPL